MSNEQNIRDAADLIFIHAITAAGDEGYVTGFDRRGHDYRNCQDAARALLASPVIRRIQAEAWDEGFSRGFYKGQISPIDMDASDVDVTNPHEEEQS